MNDRVLVALCGAALGAVLICVVLVLQEGLGG